MSKFIHLPLLLVTSILVVETSLSPASALLTGATAITTAKEQATVDVHGFDTHRQETLHDALTAYMLSKKHEANVQAGFALSLSSRLNSVIAAVDDVVDAVLRGAVSKNKRIYWLLMWHDTGRKYVG